MNGPEPDGAGRSRLAALLFPEEPRSFPGRRTVKILLRGVHALAAGLLVGTVLFAAGADAEEYWRHATAGTGMIFLALDFHETGVFLVQLRGAVVILKIGLLACVAHATAGQLWLLGALFVVSVVSSHASGRVRYLVLFGRKRFRGASTSG